MANEDTKMIAEQVATEFGTWLLNQEKISFHFYYNLGRFGIKGMYESFLNTGISPLLKSKITDDRSTT